MVGQVSQLQKLANEPWQNFYLCHFIMHQLMTQSCTIQNSPLSTQSIIMSNTYILISLRKGLDLGQPTHLVITSPLHKYQQWKVLRFRWMHSAQPHDNIFVWQGKRPQFDNSQLPSLRNFHQYICHVTNVSVCSEYGSYFQARLLKFETPIMLWLPKNNSVGHCVCTEQNDVKIFWISKEPAPELPVKAKRRAVTNDSRTHTEVTPWYCIVRSKCTIY